MLGDGFYDDEDLEMMIGTKPQYDADGNPILVKDRLKNNNAMDDYTRQVASYIQNGVIMPGGSKAGNDVGGSSSAQSTPYDHNGQLDYYEKYGQNSTLGGYGKPSGTGVRSYEEYIRQMQEAALQLQLENLKEAYEQNVSELDAGAGEVDNAYTKQKRQTTGEAERQAANWRELANAYGLNSGAIGQAALAQNNQLQNNLNTLESAQAAAQAEIERQRMLLGQQYRLQINQALAENNMNKAEMLYEEAVRVEEALREQEQFYANLISKYLQR